MSGLRPVAAGASLEDLSADDFTRNNRATAWVEAQRESLGGKGAQNIRGDGITRVKNNSGDHLPRYSVLGIDGPLFDPLIYFDAFNQEVSLIGSVPEAGTHSHKFVILQEPLDDLEVGRSWSDGIVPCKIDTASITGVGTGTGTGSGVDGATCANIMAGRTDRLQGGFSGFPIVWMDEEDDYDYDDGTGTGSGPQGDAFRWALIRMSSACGGGDTATTEDNDCCAGCVCYPDANHIITECDEVAAPTGPSGGGYGPGGAPAGTGTGVGNGLACLYDRYRIIGALPFSGETILVHDGGCTFVSDSFAPIICGETYCYHHWELVIGYVPGTATLTLVCDGTGTGTGTGCLCLTLVYRNMWYFNPICGNRFGRVFACDDVPTTIAHLFPCEICVVAVGDVCEPCPVEVVASECCADGFPNQVSILFNDANPVGPPCPIIDDRTIICTFSSYGGPGATDNPRWTNTFVYGGITYTVRFENAGVGGGGCDWRLRVFADDLDSNADSCLIFSNNGPQCPFTGMSFNTPLGVPWDNGVICGSCAPAGDITASVTPV